MRSHVRTWIGVLALVLAHHGNATPLVAPETSGAPVLHDAPAHRALPEDTCPGDHAALVHLQPTASSAGRDASLIVVVHGYGGDLRSVADVVSRARQGHEVWVACYESRSTSLIASAKQLAALVEAVPHARSQRLVVIAHSLGGIVSRWMLNEMVVRRSYARFSAIDLYAVDTPWHGWPGPSDRGAVGWLFSLARPLLRGIIDEMRARSRLFVGDPDELDPARRAGLFGVPLPDAVQVHLYFARGGRDVLSYDKGFLLALAPKLVAYYTADRAVTGDPRLMNFWRALLDAATYPAFSAEARELADDGRLDERNLHQLLTSHFPQFVGDHASVLQDSSAPDCLVNYLFATRGEHALVQ